MQPNANLLNLLESALTFRCTYEANFTYPPTKTCNKHRQQIEYKPSVVVLVLKLNKRLNYHSINALYTIYANSRCTNCFACARGHNLTQ